MERRRAVVIGGGFGGLAAANRLQAAGLQVTLFEKREQVGGRAYQMKEDGYTFDMGPSLITAPQLIEDIFRAASKSLRGYVDLVPLDPYYRVCFHDGTYIDYSGDPNAMKAQMRRFNAEDAARYDDFMAAIEPIHEAVITGGLGAQPFDTVGAMLAFLPQVMRLRAYRPVHSYARRYFQDFRHRFLFSFQPLFLGGHPFRAPSVYLMIPYLEKAYGVWFAKGGMYALVQALERLFVQQGGRVCTGAEVTAIRVERGRATGVRVDGEIVPADVVVSNADVAHTYRDLIPAGTRNRWTDRRLASMDYSMSCFLLYLGVRKTYPQLKHHTLILTERYEGLIDDIFDRKVLTEDFSLYLHAPTRTDPAMAPPGGESLYALVPVPNQESGVDWSRMAEPFTERVLDRLESWGLTDLHAHLDVLRVFTPADFERELNAYRGNAFSIEPRLTQTAYFRPHNRSEDVEGLYLVGAGTHPGAGVPGVLLSAETTTRCIRDDLGG